MPLLRKDQEGASGRAKPSPTQPRGKPCCLPSPERTAAVPDWVPAQRFLAAADPLPDSVSKCLGPCTCISAEGIEIKQQEELPSCHDHTLLKRAAKGGGGPRREGQCLGCSALRKRAVEVGGAGG